MPDFVGYFDMIRKSSILGKKLDQTKEFLQFYSKKVKDLFEKIKELAHFNGDFHWY